MVQSTIKPEIIEIDKIENGKVNLLIHWDITQIEYEMEGLENELIWDYEECKLKWILPKSYNSIDDIRNYLNGIKDEIIDWSKGSKITL